MKTRPLLLFSLLYSIVLYGKTSYGNSNEIWNSTKIAGFASQGYTRSSDNNFYGDSKKKSGSFSLREMGLNISSSLSKSLFSSAQILVRNTGQDDDDSMALDYAMIDYSRPLSSKQTYGIRIGRIKNPLGFYNETRDVPFTRSSVILPQSLYFDRTRDLSLSADGFHLYGALNKLSYNAEITIGIGKPRVDKRSIVSTLLGQRAMGTLDSDVSYLWNVFFNKNAYTLSFSGAFLQLNYDDSELLIFDDSKVSFLVNMLSFRYDAENWVITAEYADRRFKYKNLDALLPFKEFDGESYYVQAASFVTSNLKFFIRYDVFYRNRKDRRGRSFESLTTIPAHTQFAKDWTIGLRWDIHRSWMFRLEHHWVKGTAWLPNQNNPDPAENKKDWRLLAGILSFKF